MKNDIISIIVPIYNTERYLTRCIDSIIKQTYDNLQIILVDDGSIDGSLKICREYEKSDNRIKVIHTENKGVSNARNIGIDASNGEYIGFIDSDDWIKEDMYEVLYSALIENDADISQCSFTYVSKDSSIDKVISPKTNVKIFGAKQSIGGLLDEKFITGVCNKLFKRKVISNIRFEVGRKMSEDEFFNFSVFLNIKKSVYVDDIKYFYFLRQNSATNYKFNKDFLDSIYFDKKMVQIINSKFPELKRQACNKLARTSMFLACKIRQDKMQKKYINEYNELLDITKGYSRKFKLSDNFTTNYKILMIAVSINKRLFGIIIDFWLLINK